MTTEKAVRILQREGGSEQHRKEEELERKGGEGRRGKGKENAPFSPKNLSRQGCH
jgi:hypothetical protein